MNFLLEIPGGLEEELLDVTQPLLQFNGRDIHGNTIDDYLLMYIAHIVSHSRGSSFNQFNGISPEKLFAFADIAHHYVDIANGIPHHQDFPLKATISRRSKTVFVIV